MDYRKEHNRWPRFHKHWRFVVIVLAVSVTTLLPLPVFSHLRILVTPEGINMSGTFSRDTDSVYWCVLSKPETNQIQFVLLLPATTTMDWSNYTAWPLDGDDYFNLQVKSNRHQWKIQNTTDLKTGVQSVRLRDVTANTNSVLNLEKGRFWQLNDAGHATRLETIDAATLASIFAQVKMIQTNLIAPQENFGH